METYYFLGGTFAPSGMGYNYKGLSSVLITVSATSRDIATQMAEKYCAEKFGSQEYKDMWYGEHAYNWICEPHNVYGFNKLLKENRFEVVKL